MCYVYFRQQMVINARRNNFIRKQKLLAYFRFPLRRLLDIWLFLSLRFFSSTIESVFMSVELQHLIGGSVPPLRVLGDLSPAERAGPLPIEPGGQTVLAEDVSAVEQDRGAEVVVADGARPAGGFHLVAARGAAVAL